jgi:hypothetical protein
MNVCCFAKFGTTAYFHQKSFETSGGQFKKVTCSLLVGERKLRLQVGSHLDSACEQFVNYKIGDSIGLVYFNRIYASSFVIEKFFSVFFF